MKYRLFPVLLAVCCFCRAEDFVLADGTVLQDAKLLRTDADSAMISHSAGVQRVKYDRLTAELQQRFGLTPQAVQAYYEKKAQAKRDKALAEEKLAAAQRAALQTSTLSPRYVTGADIITIYSAWDTIPAACAEYLAAEWNRREAARCNLSVEAKRFADEADRLAARINEYRSASADEKRRIASLEEELRTAKGELQKTQETVKSQRKELKRLTEEASQNHGTLVISNPTYIPVYRPAPIILRRPIAPPPRRPNPLLPPHRAYEGQGVRH